MAFQSIVGAKLTQVSATTAYTIAYTAPTDSRVYVKDIDLCNTTAASLTVYIHLVSASSSPAASNALFYNLTVPAYTTVQWTGSQIMNANDTIQVKASATGCTINITGGIAT
jgi:hypothetical protein